MLWTQIDVIRFLWHRRCIDIRLVEVFKAITKCGRNAIMSFHVVVSESDTCFDGFYTKSAIRMRWTFSSTCQRCLHLTLGHAVQASSHSSHIVTTEFLLMRRKTSIHALELAVRSLMGHHKVEAFLVGDTHVEHLLTVENKDVIILCKRHTRHHACCPILMNVHRSIHIEEITCLLYRLHYHFVCESGTKVLMSIVEPAAWQKVV